MNGTKATFEQNNGENLPNLMKDKLQTQKMLQATHRIDIAVVVAVMIIIITVTINTHHRKFAKSSEMENNHESNRGKFFRSPHILIVLKMEGKFFILIQDYRNPTQKMSGLMVKC